MPNVEKFKLPDGRLVDAEQIEITSTSESWDEYLLEDGSVLKIKLVASKVVRLVDQYDNNGDPVYFVQSTNVLSVKSPDSLKRSTE